MTSAKISFPRRLSAVIFDLDGTLVDTADEFVPAVQNLRAENGLGPMDPTRIRASVSNGARALVRLGLQMQEQDARFEEQRLRLLALYGNVLGTKARLYPGIADLLQQLESRGIAWGIATNKPRDYTRPLLEKMAIRPAPGSVVCPEDVAQRKPDPESLLLNCRELQCAPGDAVYIGDHLRDIEAGRSAGMFTVAAAYGYIEADDDPCTWGADAVVEKSEALAELILERGDQ